MTITPDILKIGLFNEATISKWFYTDAAGISLPPVVTSLFAPADYVTPRLLAPLTDNDQNLCVFGGTANNYFTFDFGDVVTPSMIAIANHNAFKTDDIITIYKDFPVAPAGIVSLIQYPVRSADLFWPLRMNDAWVNSAGESSRYWTVKITLKDNTRRCRIGEIFFCFNHSYKEFETPPSWGARLNVDLHESYLPLTAGGGASVYGNAPSVEIPLGFDKRNSTNDYQDILWTLAAANRFPGARQILVWHDRLCFFGNIGETADFTRIKQGNSAARIGGLSFLHEMPRRFVGDEIDP